MASPRPTGSDSVQRSDGGTGRFLSRQEATSTYAPITGSPVYASALFTPATSSTLRKGLARVRAGTGDCKILCVGDSTTAGVGVLSAPNGAGSPLSYPYQLAAILHASLIPAARGLGIPPSNIGSGNPDTRWTAGSGWAPTSNFAWATGADYKWTSSASPANLVYTDPVLADSYDVYYLKNTGLGTFTATATGGSGSVVNTSATTGIGKTTITAGSAATTNTVTIAPSASLGDVHIVGIEPSLSTTSRVRVGNAGVGSSRAVTHWNGNGSGAGWNSQACIKAYAPDLTIISLGINDAINAASASAYTAAVQPLITAAQVSGDVLILPPIPSTSSAAAGVLTNEAAYVAALQGLGYRYGDLIARWPSGDAINTLGFMSGDAYHPNALGYADLAQWLAAGIRAV